MKNTINISKKHYIDYVSEPLVIYYIHDGEQISTNPKKRLQGTKRKIEKYKEYLESHPKQYNKCLLEYAYALAMSGNIKLSISTWKKAKKVSETNIKEKPKMIIAGSSAYSRSIDFKRFRSII